MIAKVVNIRTENCDVYIGRSSKWGNPFRIGKDGDRKEVIKKYKQWIMRNKKLIQSLNELKGKTLGCHCWPLPCHGDVLIELIKDLKV